MSITKKFLEDILEMNMHNTDKDETAADKDMKESSHEEKKETEMNEEERASGLAQAALHKSWKEEAMGLPVHASDAASQVPDHLKEYSDKESMNDDKEEMDEAKKADEDDKTVVESEDKNDKEEMSEEKEESEKEEMNESSESEDEEDEKEDELSDDEKADVEEAAKALTHGEELSESFREKVSTIFEAAVKRTSGKRILAETKKIKKQYAAKFEETEKELSEALVDKLDSYLNYVVEEWMKENEVALVSELRSDLTENFIVGLKSLFESNFIDVPEEKMNILSEQEGKIEKLQNELNEEIKRSVELKKQYNSLKRNNIVNSMCDGMSKNEATKFVELCEGVSFSDENSFEKKLQVIKEGYFPNNKIDSKDISDNLLVEGGIFPQDGAETKTEVDAFADVITKMVNAKNGRK